MQREELRHGAGAERETDDVRTVELQCVEQARHVERLLPAIGFRLARLVALAGAAGVERDDAEILRQIGDHAGRDPALEVRCAAMQQHDRLALAAVDVVDLDAAEIGEPAVLDRKRGGDGEAEQDYGDADG